MASGTTATGTGPHVAADLAAPVSKRGPGTDRAQSWRAQDTGFRKRSVPLLTWLKLVARSLWLISLISDVDFQVMWSRQTCQDA